MLDFDYFGAKKKSEFVLYELRKYIYLTIMFLKLNKSTNLYN